MLKKFSRQESDIFYSHRMILSDKSFQKKLKHLVEKGLGPIETVRDVIGEYLKQFESMDDPHFRERAGDLEDIRQRLMEHLIGYDRAILVDAFALDEPLGSILVLKLSDLPNYSAFHTTNAHDTSLQNAIKFGRAMGAPLPDDVTVVGIATKHVYDFSEALSPPIAEAVPQAARIVLNLLKQTAMI